MRRFPGHPLLEAWAAVSRGILLRKEGRLEEALAEERRALDAKQSLLGPDHLDVALSKVNIALVLAGAGSQREAEAMHSPDAGDDHTPGRSRKCPRCAGAAESTARP